MRPTFLFIAVTLVLATRSFTQDAAEKPAQDSSEKSETCTMEGTVYAAASGAPLKSVTVTLKAGDESLHQLTDLRGHFIFTGLLPGAYEVHASKAGYVRAGYRLEGEATKETLELKPGEKLDKVQFRLTQAGVILGRVTDENGEPVAGVEMDALVPGYFKRDVVMYADAGRFAMTNDLGEYRLYGLPPGAYYLAASVVRDGEGMNSLRFMGLKANPILYYPGVISTSGAERIRIKAGQEIHIDFPLRIPKLFAVSGRVVNPRGGPEARARIRIRPQEHDLGLLATSTNQTESDAQGNFVFTQIVQGAYVISAVDDPTGERGVEEDRYWTEERVEVAGDNVSGLQLQLREKLKIPGKITVAGGPKVDFDRLVVHLNGESEFEPEEGSSAGWVGKNGDFVIENVRPARNRLRMYYGLPDGYYLRSAFFGSQNVLEEGLNLSGKVESGQLLKITVSPGAGQIQGIVRRGDAPIRGALVRVFPETPNPYRGEISFERTVEDGRFVIKNVPPGKYLVRAYASAADDDDGSSSDSANTATIDLAENESKTVQLKLP
jgi:protocatechuate 3,4-dioxygenase beta subunit